MKQNAQPQKNTLFKITQANAIGIYFKRVLFSPHREEFISTPIYFSPTNGLTANTTSCASNVNSFGQSLSGLDTLPLRTDRRASGKKGVKEMAGDVLNQTLVLLIKCCGRLTVCASKSATAPSAQPLAVTNFD